MDPSALAPIPLFAGLSDEHRSELANMLTPKSFKAQETVFWIGDAGADFYIVSEGRVSMTIPDDSGKETTLAVLGPGNFFGELSLLDGGPRTATARAWSDLELLCLERQNFLEFLKNNPSAAIHMLGILGRRQRETLERLRGIRNANEAIDAMSEQAPIWNRVADYIAAMSASQGFVVLHILWFGAWVIYNLIRSAKGFDPFPFQLLTLVVSLEAIFLSIFVLVSTNRQSEKDRVRADLDYQVNLKAHSEVMQLHQKVDRLEAKLGQHENKAAIDEQTARA